MTLTNTEFQSILDDPTKIIEGDIVWTEDEDHSPSVEFRAEVRNQAGWPLFVKGSYNRLAKTLSYVLILKTEGRIYGLDLGKDHHNPSCQRVGEKHKHRWTEALRDKDAFVPPDIYADASAPGPVWEEFLAEARIQHLGAMESPVTLIQEELW